jgi:hypothetical protein
MKENYHHYHTPPQPVSTRLRCPVCHQEVYSRGGIHPQCAVRRNDPPKAKHKEPKLTDAVGPVTVVTKAPEAVRIVHPDRTPV